MSSSSKPLIRSRGMAASARTSDSRGLSAAVVVANTTSRRLSFMSGWSTPDDDRLTNFAHGEPIPLPGKRLLYALDRFQEWLVAQTK
jgi:hypothetical protein